MPLSQRAASRARRPSPLFIALSPLPRSVPWRAAAGACALLAVLGLAGCGSTPSRPASRTIQETFAPSSPHMRSFPTPPAATCEAARRALLSHGYVVSRASAELVNARKSFQPSADQHVEVEFHVVCALEGRDRSSIFVNAVEDRYALKKVSSSASLGVGPVGSLSVPFGSTSDSLVKVASETIEQAAFYDRFFGLVEHYLAQREEDEEPETVSATTAPAASAPTEGVSGGQPSRD